MIGSKSNYREINKLISKILKVKRNKKLERYIDKNIYGKYSDSQTIEFKLMNLRKERKLAESNKGFIDYYNVNDKVVTFNNLKCVACHMLTIYFMTENLNWINSELELIKNPFMNKFVKDRMIEVSCILLNEKKNIPRAVAI